MPYKVNLICLEINPVSLLRIRENSHVSLSSMLSEDNGRYSIKGGVKMRRKMENGSVKLGKPIGGFGLQLRMKGWVMN